MIDLSAHIRLSTQPRSIDIGADKAMTVANAAANIPIIKTDDLATVWLSLTAFGRQAETLLKHSKGDLLNIHGTLQLSQWTAPDGTERQQWSVAVQSIVSARTTRAGGKRRASGADGGCNRYTPHAAQH